MAKNTTKWITVNGSHVPVNKDNKSSGLSKIDKLKNRKTKKKGK